MHRSASWIVTAWVVACTTLGLSAQELLRVDAVFRPKMARPGDLVELVLTIHVDAAHCAYGNQETTFVPVRVNPDQLSSGRLAVVGAAKVPGGTARKVAGGEHFALPQTFEVTQRFAVPAGLSATDVVIHGVIDYQLTTGDAVLPPAEVPWQTKLAVVSAVIAQGLTSELCLQNGVVWTGTQELQRGDLCARFGRIANSVGRAPSVSQIDLGGAFVVPGLQDAHGHLLGLGSSLIEVNLIDTTSFQQVVERTAAAAKNMPVGSWVVGRGWDQNDWSESTMPQHGALSAATPDHPVWLVRVDGHAGLLNAAGLRAAGIDKNSKSAAGGEVVFDERGEPTGVLIDAAMAAVPDPPLSSAQIRERLRLAHDQCLRHGLTCVHDAGVTKAVLDEMVALHREGRWHLRTYVMLHPSERELIERGVWQTKDGVLVVRAVKCYADGALGSRGARLLAGYADRPSYLGLVSMPKAMLLEIAQRCADSGMQLCTHAIGDAANRTVLDAYSLVQADAGLESLRFRIEHAQIVADSDVARFLELGVLPSMQPTHLTSDMPWAETRLGPERVLRAYTWRRFLDRGCMVPFGSDFPVESVDPRKGLFAAVTTRGIVNGESKVLRPDQKLSREEALRGFTLHAAFAMFAEKQLGTIERGKHADFTVFDRNLLTCSDDELLTAKVLLTVVNGRVVHDGRGQ